MRNQTWVLMARCSSQFVIMAEFYRSFSIGLCEIAAGYCNNIHISEEKASVFLTKEDGILSLCLAVSVLSLYCVSCNPYDTKAVRFRVSTKGNGFLPHSNNITESYIVSDFCTIPTNANFPNVFFQVSTCLLTPDGGSVKIFTHMYFFWIFQHLFSLEVKVIMLDLQVVPG